MLLKWLAALFQHGLVSVFALLIAIAAVWWVEPTTNGGIAFLLFVVFMLALAVIELGRKLVLRLKPAAPAAEPAPQPSVDAPPASPPPPAVSIPGPGETPTPVSRSRKRPRAKS
jgi:hypothetical protein